MRKSSLSPSVYNLVNKLKEIGFINDMIDFTNKYIISRYNGFTINEFLSKIEDDDRQHTTVLTSDISYFGIKNYLAIHANKFLFEKTKGFIRILDKREYIIRYDFEEFKSLSFDVVFEVGGTLVPLEIKVSLNKEGFTGSTHSTSKVTDYLLISLDIDRDIVLNDNVKPINSVFMSITNIDKDLWRGKASNNNSRTTYKFNIYDSENNKIDYSDGIIYGYLKKNIAYYGIIREKVD